MLKSVSRFEYGLLIVLATALSYLEKLFYLDIFLLKPVVLSYCFMYYYTVRKCIFVGGDYKHSKHIYFILCRRFHCEAHIWFNS